MNMFAKAPLPVALRDMANAIRACSETGLAMQAAEKLAGEDIEAAVVSLPCFELFAEQSVAYRAEVLGTAPCIGIEAAIRQSWDLVLRPQDPFIGMTSGASAPAKDLYKAFGITANAIAAAAQKLMAKRPSPSRLDEGGLEHGPDNIAAASRSCRRA
jgi:transketolase